MSRLKIGEFMEEGIFKGIVCRTVDHGNLESIIVAFSGNRSREGEDTSINIRDVDEILNPKEKDAAASAVSWPISKATKAGAADRGDDKRVNAVQLRKMLLETLTIRCVHKVTIWKKFHVFYSFLVCKLVVHIVIFTFYSIIIRTTFLVPEVHIPKRGRVCIPTITTLLSSVGPPSIVIVVWRLVHPLTISTLVRCSPLCGLKPHVS